MGARNDAMSRQISHKKSVQGVTRHNMCEVAGHNKAVALS